MNLNHIERLLILACATSRSDSIFSFALLVGFLIVISSSAVGSRICVITARIKKHDEKLLLVKTTINAINALISKALIDSDTIHAKFVLVNTILISYNDINNQRSNQRG